MPARKYVCREAESDFELTISAYDEEEAAANFIERADQNAGGEIGCGLMQNGGTTRVVVVAEDGIVSLFDISAEATVSWYAHKVGDQHD